MQTSVTPSLIKKPRTTEVQGSSMVNTMYQNSNPTESFGITAVVH